MKTKILSTLLFAILSSQSVYAVDTCAALLRNRGQAAFEASASGRKLTPDPSMPQVPLFPVARAQLGLRGKGGPVLMGYEILKPREVIFHDPQAIRSHFGNQVNALMQYNAKNLADLPSMAQRIRAHNPGPVAEQIIGLLQASMIDATSREVPFDFITISIRGESTRVGFPKGHSHEMTGLTYVAAPIGKNSEVDRLNRFSLGRLEVEESDYISSNHKDQVIVFGGAWHRTPRLSANEPRLLIIVELGQTPEY